MRNGISTAAWIGNKLLESTNGLILNHLQVQIQTSYEKLIREDHDQTAEYYTTHHDHQTHQTTDGHLEHNQYHLSLSQDVSDPWTVLDVLGRCKTRRSGSTDDNFQFRVINTQFNTMIWQHDRDWDMIMIITNQSIHKIKIILGPFLFHIGCSNMFTRLGCLARVKCQMNFKQVWSPTFETSK